MKNTQGGKREGAGRKKKSNVAHTVRCHPSVIEKVREYAAIESESVASLENYLKTTTVHLPKEIININRYHEN